MYSSVQKTDFATVAVLLGITHPLHDSILGHAHTFRFIRTIYFCYGWRLGRGILKSVPVALVCNYEVDSGILLSQEEFTQTCGHVTQGFVLKMPNTV